MGDGYPCPRFFPRPLVSGSFQGVPLSWLGEVPQDRLGRVPQDRGIPRPGLGYHTPPPPRDRLYCGRYASRGFPQEDFLVDIEQGQRLKKNFAFARRELTVTTTERKYCTHVSVAVNEFAHSVDPSGQGIDGEYVSEVALHDGVLRSVHICNVN